MNTDTDLAQVQNNDTAGVAQKVVFFTAVFSTFLGVLYLIGLIGKLIVDGTVHSTSSQPVQTISAVTAILLDISLLILFVALRRQISGSKAVFADLAVVFMILVCATSSINWFVQLAVLPKLVQDGHSTLLALVDVHDTGSIMYAIEHLGWGIFYGMAIIFMALAMGDGRLESLMRWLFIAGGTLSVLHIFGVVTSNLVIGDLGYLAWGILLPLTTTILAVRYRRMQT